MSTADVKDNKNKLEDPSKSGQPAPEAKQASPLRPDQPSTAPKAEGPSNQETQVSTANAQPLAPPPKPSQQQATGTPDYFNANHNGSHFSLEPNPFEQSFGNPSTETPGKFAGLPSVASLTSPAPIGPPGGTPGWQNSLRSGPLSPAMLPGPAASNPGYFDESFRGGNYPTPNESSLRTGLTPGGAGSMFPTPSPNSQALFNSLQSGGATPGTLEFQRAALNAAARTKVEAGGSSNNNNTNNSHKKSSNNHNMSSNGTGINKQEYQPAQQQQQGPQDPFSSHPESDAVNSLYMLANTGTRNANQFAVPNQPHGMITNVAQMQPRMGGQSQDASPTQYRQSKQSIGSMGSGDGGSFEGEDASPDTKPTPRSKGKRGGKAGQATNGRRKAEETPGKPPASKRSKMSLAMEEDEMRDDMSGEEDDGQEEMLNSNGKKMTDEEKRKNFLERNRVAALKCRQRKKQWLANLQTKVEIFSSENDALSAQCTQLREEIVNLKTLLLAHKDCPVSHQQGISGNTMAQVIGEFSPHNHPYGMQLPNGQQMMAMPSGQGMQRS